METYMTATMQPIRFNCHSNASYTNVNHSQNCGVCEKEGGEVFWPNHKSRVAHRICFLRIDPIQAKLIKEILDLFDSFPNLEKDRAHARAVTAVRVACKTTLLEFLEKNGTEALKKIFNTIGIRAAARKTAKL